VTLPSQDTIQTYGGSLSNYGPVIDPTTDRDAAAANQAYATTAMASRMVPRVEVAIVGNATMPTLASWEAVWKQATLTPPTLSRVGTGHYRATLPASVQDELGVAHTVNLTRAWSNVEAPGYTSNAVVSSPNVVDVYVYSGASLSDAVGATVVVWAR
jgi:hypothetical protein